MTLWRNLARVSLEHARRQNAAALHFGVAYPVNVGSKAFTVQFEPCRAGYPLRLHGQAAGATLTLDCDAQALFPELSRDALIQAGENAHRLIVQAFDDWLSAVEGALGFTLDLNGTSFDVSPKPGAVGLVLTRVRNHRVAHFALDSEVVDEWLNRRPPFSNEMPSFWRQLPLPLPVCMAGPALTLPRLHRIRCGDALLLDPSSQYLRVPLAQGARRILLRPSGDYILIDRPMIDEENDSADVTSELIPAAALTFPFDAVIGTLSLTLDELMRLRTGSIVSLQMPVRNNTVLLLCQGVPFARGELIDIDDALGVRIVDMTQFAQSSTISQTQSPS
jgi:type III secretion protein Q